MLKNIKVKISKIYYRIKFIIFKRQIQCFKVLSIEETLDYIIENKVSVSRFGDGELQWAINVQHDSFQDSNHNLAKRLNEVISSNEANHIVCLVPYLMGFSSEMSHDSLVFWQYMLGKFGIIWKKKVLDVNRTYYNTCITRFYMNTIKNGVINHEVVSERFNKLKKIWENRNILIVEGKYSRMGIDNDLFAGCTSVKRILVPNVNAFDKYDTIYSTVIKLLNASENILILLSVGPTATILAYDLSKLGYQAIDIGHIDIEYTWFKKGFTTKQSVPGKYVNEAKNHEVNDEEIGIHEMELYKTQVICEIE